MPPHAALLQMLTGKWLSSAISTVARFGIADLLAAGPKPVNELAASSQTLEDPLRRLLRALAGVGVFTELEDGRFANTPLSEPLRSNASPGIRNMAIMMLDDWHVRAWGQLPWCVETGKPAPFKLYGKHGWEAMADYPDQAQNFNRAMTDMSSSQAPAVAASYDFSGIGTLLDAGGGLGFLLASILAANPHLQGILLDQPSVIDQAKSAGILAPYQDRCQIQAGSFFEALPPTDAVIMKAILHDWDDADALRILNRCREALRPGGRILIVDHVLPGRNEPGFAKFLDIEMLVAAGGRERSTEEWTRLFTSAGFRLTRIIPTPAPIAILEGVPA